MEKLPAVSVTVPAFNEEGSIGKLLQSLRHQTVADFEVIIVDNGSADSTPDLVEAEIGLGKYPLKLLTEERKGVGFARRRGMDDAVSRGIRYLAGTDADSAVPPNWIETITAAFAQTNADALFGLSDFDWSGFKEHPEQYAAFQEAWMVRRAVVTQVEPIARGVNFAITAHMYETLGGITQPVAEDGSPLPGEDVELKRMVEERGGKIGVLPVDVRTSPRRILSAIMLDSPNDYFKGGFEDIRNEDELRSAVLRLDIGRVRHFTDETTKRMFQNFVVKKVDTELWEKAKMFVGEDEDAFRADAAKLSPDKLYEKYRETFIASAKEVSNKCS